MSKRYFSILPILLFFNLFLSGQSLVVSSHSDSVLSLERIFFKPALTGYRPGDPDISSDSRFIFYSQDDSSGKNSRIRIMNADGSNNHAINDSLLGELEWSSDGKTIACTRDGDIFLTDTGFTNFTRLTKDSHPWGMHWSPDGRWLEFSVPEKIMALPFGKMGLVQIAEASGKDVSIQFRDFTPDSKRIVFTEWKRGETKEFLIPQYLDKEVTTRTIKNGNGSTRIGVAPIDTGKIVWIKLPDENKYFTRGIDISPDGKALLIDRYGIDRKTRAIFTADLDSGKAVQIYDEKDPAWIEGAGYSVRWTLDGKHIVYTSEREGWNQLYMMAPDGKDTHRLTQGEWEIHWYAFHPNGNILYLLGNKDDHARWQFYSLDLNTKELTRISTRDGSYDNPVLAKDGSFIVAKYSDLIQPDEIVRVPTSPAVSLSANGIDPADLGMKSGRESQLTNTVPKEFHNVQWTVPEIVHFNSRDNKSIPAFIYKPAHFDPSKKYPVVVFVHGAGYLQNVYRAWSYYDREFMFHTRLTQLGYVVFEVEYRGSAGLGRDFRTDVYMHLGGKDLDDEVDGLNYLKGLGYIDPARVGMYGGSYGGFMTLMALFRTDQYACGAALRAVTNWENYYRHNTWYTESRLGKPEDHPEAYKISSPITYADSLKKPLLILHGVVDDNVFFQDAVQLIDKLQKSKKKFELMIYPREAHSFSQPESWYDEYSRIEEFFNKNLKP
ncbi:MAG: prolyl oligopeptidase family serine peptidase [Bacteroidota bacterium]